MTKPQIGARYRWTWYYAVEILYEPPEAPGFMKSYLWLGFDNPPGYPALRFFLDTFGERYGRIVRLDERGRQPILHDRDRILGVTGTLQ